MKKDTKTFKKRSIKLIEDVKQFDAGGVDPAMIEQYVKKEMMIVYLMGYYRAMKKMEDK